ncbi:MAG: molybdenum cofactor cytidylyltransferase [Blastochloris sp.]|nr:molybdenum cofactor cytidylyltransferase [Blastochloris sp.]
MVVAMVLAAGTATRMGQPKQLLDWDGQPLVRVVVRNALASSLDQVLVVVGYAREAVADALHDLPVQVVNNPHYTDGQSTSVKAGIASLPAKVAAVLVVLGDQPFVTATVIDTIITAWRTSQAPIVAPVYQGQRGHPVLFDRSLFPELLAIDGDQGARSLIQQHHSVLQLLPFDDPRPLIDIDTWQDYQRISGLDNNT